MTGPEMKHQHLKKKLQHLHYNIQEDKGYKQKNEENQKVNLEK